MSNEVIKAEAQKMFESAIKEYKKQLNGLIKDNQTMALALIGYHKEIKNCVRCGEPVQKLTAKNVAEEYL